MRIEGTFLRSKLGRRIFLMFCIAVAIPAAAVFLLTYRTAASNARHAGQTALRAENKHFALTVFERLQAAQAMLDRLDAGTQDDTIGQPLLEPFFAEIAVLDPSRPHWSGRSLAAELARQPPRLLQTTKLVIVPVGDGTQPRIVLLSRGKDASGGVFIAGTLRPSFLWGRAEDLAIDGRICVDAGKQRLTCVGEPAPRDESEASIRDDWELFLKSQFAADSWRFSAIRRAEPMLAGHLHVLAPVAVGLLLLVLMLSSVQIRRILVPLEALLSRIRAVSQDARPHPEPETDDELGALSRTFSEMEQRIHAQMETLRTLAEVDRLILDRVPVAAVIEVVIARIRAIVDAPAIGITLKDRSHDCKHYVGFQGDREIRSGERRALAPLPEEAYELQEGVQAWSDTGDPGPGFAGHGVDRIAYLALRRRDGSCVWVALGLSAGQTLDDARRAEVRELAERIAVAEAVEAHESLLVYQARHDPLTQLPNRLAAVEALTRAIERVKGTEREFAAVFIDLDRFKSINDGLGHALGDLILTRTGERIRQSVGDGDFVARFGGDEFFVILHGVSGTIEATRACTQIMEAFLLPIVADEIELLVKFSAGVALYPRHGSDAQELIHNADVAMYRGKKSGGGRIEFFEEEMNAAALTRVQLENDLRQAIKLRRLTLEYQPRIDSRNGRIVGAEALARWTHPTKGNIPPAAFVALAEECGLIEELGGFVIDQACHQMGAWKRSGFVLPVMAVNLSSYQLRSGNLMRVVGAAIERSGMRWNELEIEVTESLFINDSGAAAQQLQAIRDAGATVAIDDFGVGYSSLAYLTRLPTDTLKIDRAFIAGMGEDAASAAVVRSIVALANVLEKRIVAEGVESMAQVAMLSAMGCHIIQGYAYYPPLGPEAMQRLLVGPDGTALLQSGALKR